MEQNISWQNRRINDLVIDIKSGFSFPKNKLSESGTGQLRPYNITTSLTLDLSSLVYIPESSPGIDLKSYFLKEGDILFNNTNSRELVGKTAIVEEDIDVCFSNHITRIRVDQSIVEPKWFALCLHRHWFLGTFEAKCKRWIGQAGFSPTKLNQLYISTPDRHVQKVIVFRIEELTKKVEEVKKIHEQIGSDIHGLMNSIFDKAFQGQLVKNIPNKHDEHAKSKHGSILDYT